MKAWHFLGIGKSLTMVDIPEPEAGPGEVVIDVKAAGMCHSDIGYIDGLQEGVPSYAPIVLGHEIAGVVTALGPDTTGVKIGDRVAVAPNIPEWRIPGVTSDGGYAEKTVSRVGDLVPIPDAVSFEQAAVGTDAGMTSHHAVRVSGQVEAGMRVGIVGLGGLGLIGARIAVILGAEVYAAEVNESVHQAGLDAGITAVHSDVLELAPYEPDVIIDFAGFGTTTAGAIQVVRHGGRVVLVGMGRPEGTLPLFTFIRKQLDMVGSLGGTAEDVEGVFELVASGQLDPKTTTFGIDYVGDALERLRRHETVGRLVMVND
jgi:propanol-preferring alcohol dehydrogenase